MYCDEGWWHLEFELKPSLTMSCVAADNLRVGSPVSVGYRTLRHDESLTDIGVKWHTVAILNKLSILRHGEKPAYPGAEVTFILPRKHIPRVAKSQPAAPPARATRVPASEPPAGEVFYGAGPYGGTGVIARRDDLDMQELDSRMNWVEARTGRPADMEVVMRDMQREMYGPSLDEVAREHGIVLRRYFETNITVR